MKEKGLLSTFLTWGINVSFPGSRDTRGRSSKLRDHIFKSSSMGVKLRSIVDMLFAAASGEGHVSICHNLFLAKLFFSTDSKLPNCGKQVGHPTTKLPNLMNCLHLLLLSPRPDGDENGARCWKLRFQLGIQASRVVIRTHMNNKK